MTHFTAPNGDECVIVEKDPGDTLTLEDVDSVSFVNGIRTQAGGIHVNVWRDTIFRALVTTFNTKKKGKKATTTLKTSAKEMYPYMTLFIRTEVDRPSFASQTKDCLTGLKDENGKNIDYRLLNAKSKTQKESWNEMLEKNLKKMMRWNFITLLEEKIAIKEERKLARKEGVSSSRLRLDPSKATDAIKAGTRDSSKCTLWIGEGQSAIAFVNRGIGSIPKGRDHNGSYAIRGKFINVRNATTREVNSNEEVSSLKKMIGLHAGVDYSDPDNRKELRYGKICIVADADDDGIHIRGLLLNFFFHSYRALIEENFVESFSTAVAAVMFKKKSLESLKFYSNPEFKKWYEESSKENKIDRVNYLKGLGSINPREAPGYFQDPKVISYVPDDEQEETMKLGFDDRESDARKVWITDSLASEDSEYQYEGIMTLSAFVSEQLIIYHRMVLFRALPCIWDGFKESQRKILYAILKRNYSAPNDLERVTGAIKEETAYHHGGNSIAEAITKMGQGFVGSNNIPLCVNDGEFGTRVNGGSDHAKPRYLKTMPEKIARCLFPAVDDALLERKTEDNVPVEWEYYIPILPMILVNGANGIASGFSTNIPSYNPKDLIRRVRRWLKKGDEGVDEMDWMVPWS